MPASSSGGTAFINAAITIAIGHAPQRLQPHQHRHHDAGVPQSEARREAGLVQRQGHVRHLDRSGEPAQRARERERRDRDPAGVDARVRGGTFGSLPGTLALYPHTL